MKKFILLLCLFFAAHQLYAEKPLFYRLKTDLSSTSSDFFNLKLHQQIDFECEVHSICPIDQSPESVTITFKRMAGEFLYNDQKQSFDTDIEELFSLEFQCLKKLLNFPIFISLNRDMTIKEKSQDFAHLLNLSTLEKRFISEDLLSQILEAVFTPKRASLKEGPYLTSLYFPFQTKMPSDHDLKKGKVDTYFTIDAPLELEGLYSTSSNPFSLHLSGQMKAKAHWKNNSYFVESYHQKHSLKEGQPVTLFDHPLTFDYELNLDAIY